MDTRRLYWAIGVGILILGGGSFLRPPPLPTAEGLLPSEVSQIRWELNAPLLFRSRSWYALTELPGDLWSWRAKDRSLIALEQQHDGSIHVLSGTKQGGTLFVVRRGSAGWECVGIGDWDGGSR